MSQDKDNTFDSPSEIWVKSPSVVSPGFAQTTSGFELRVLLAVIGLATAGTAGLATVRSGDLDLGRIGLNVGLSVWGHIPGVVFAFARRTVPQTPRPLIQFTVALPAFVSLLADLHFVANPMPNPDTAAHMRMISFPMLQFVGSTMLVLAASFAAFPAGRDHDNPKNTRPR